MRHWKLIGILLVAVALMINACDRMRNESPDRHREVIVFAAASLAEAFTDIANQFEANNPETTVILNFAGSQQLSHQLSQGAPADVFASANHRQMKAAIETGRVVDGSQKSFAGNNLVIVIPAENPGGVSAIQDLSIPGLRLVVAAQEVPAGQYAQSFLEAAGRSGDYGPSFRDGVLANIVSYEENVRAVLSKVSLGEADGGVVYTSDIVGSSPGKVGFVTIPVEINMVADYPIAPISDGKDAEMGQLFIEFVLSHQGQAILGKHGFLPGEIIS